MGKVAVVGLGYSGAIILERLKHLTPALSIDVFDTAGSSGSGLAYQQDILSNLVNRPANLMYLREHGDFKQWLQTRGMATCNGYQPRPVFGKFIEESVQASLREHTSISFYREHITGMTSSRGRYDLHSASGERPGYKAVVLATGNPEPTDFYRLKGAPGYINNPYPTTRLAEIRSDSIGVLGNQLSAIDVALTLLDADPENHVTMLTRSSKIPNYSESYQPRALKVLNEHTIRHRLRCGGSALKTVRALFDEELQAQGIDTTLDNLMRDHSQASVAREEIYSVFSSTNLIVPMIWNLLSERERKVFVGRFRGAWRQLRVPIPKENWIKIHQHMHSGRLVCLTGLTDVSVTAGGFLARGRNFNCRLSNVVNATGAGDAMQGALYQNLAACGICSEHQYGGIDVDYDDCRVIHRQGPSNIFAIGAPTTGVFYAVSNIDVLQMQAETIYRNLRALST
ncbi:FAD/NAD(P)-binding protein [Pseudomonas sp. B21-012]|uniref:FAD/NAD(P)-binding protein n=1 Tax=Pseudomonas sp. B21-012 TaxID=2895472 RepID=UPI00215EA489|nr:FAD/NAD(P)-binding protein [Pseudomonas sp. B21-012]UVM56602.1 FAD/NAD(P)-binding protein [Pseudomonas sp. B21-012]